MQSNLIELSQTWQQALSNAITSPEELLKMLDLDPHLLPAAQKASDSFALRVPRGFVARMQKGNLHDPLLRQVLPIDEELKTYATYGIDPLGETTANPMSGILHKYQGRVLLVITGVCGVNCRYCFRRHFNYTDNNPGSAGWAKAIAYIAQDSSIKEVIFSGGDPLIASDKRLQTLAQQLETIPHVQTLRIHTRMPVILPERITPALVNWLGALRLKTVMVIHCNHANEIDQPVANAMQTLKAAGVTLLNQAVLLKGVNDNPNTLIELSEKLFAIGVLPYYLHLLDKVQGAAHFDVPAEIAKTLIQTITAQLPGYLVPKLVWEKAGAVSKLPV